MITTLIIIYLVGFFITAVIIGYNNWPDFEIAVPAMFLCTFWFILWFMICGTLLGHAIFRRTK